jgi:hypothetical protein
MPTTANGPKATPGPNTLAPGADPTEKYRILHVQIPDALYWHTRNMALQSHMALKNYIAAILLDACPILSPSTGSIAPLSLSPLDGRDESTHQRQDHPDLLQRPLVPKGIPNS